MISDEYFKLVSLHEQYFAQWINESRQINYLSSISNHRVGWYVTMCIRKEKELHKKLKQIDEKLYLLSWVGA